jgi:hypothetical protein
VGNAQLKVAANATAPRVAALLTFSINIFKSPFILIRQQFAAPARYARDLGNSDQSADIIRPALLGFQTLQAVCFAYFTRPKSGVPDVYLFRISD